MWWALIEEIALHAKEMAGEKEMAYSVRGFIVCKNIWPAPIGEMLVCHCRKKLRCKIMVYFLCTKMLLQINNSTFRNFK